MLLLAGPARLFASRFFSASIPTVPPQNNSILRTSCRPSRPSSMASEESEPTAVSDGEWQRWGTSSPLPSLVAEVIADLSALERDFDAQMSFGGLGGKLQGSFKVQEDKKHRAVYQSLTDSEKKLQFFSARQVACRLLGSRGYLCQKDFLRQNNTGKLLWQIFGTQAASMCIFGIHEQEEIMWDIFRHSGKSRVWFLYPNKNVSPKSIKDVLDRSFTSPEGHTMDLEKDPLNFILIDGTWSNSAAMYRRLKEKWSSLWGDGDMPCVSLSSTGASVMHKLRPQPSWDRTCTAAAAASLLSELNYHHSKLGPYGLEKQAEAVENGLDILLDALTARRLRKGRSITRKERRPLHLN